ncbi:hypothetical protein PoB_003605200 [Plakobranchus ocellatus]|uniref:Uncharacterized protein n=1 Tax=Plakobranchus ocellatus TaxID=259542 RepID=A0AAV4AQF7_9GAST|nr:hypothetical protein PoB_003605200 [Plakobranchus ocellatus]
MVQGPGLAEELVATPQFEVTTEKSFEISPQQGDLMLSGPPSGQGASSGARTRDGRVPADLRADSQGTVLPTPPEPARERGTGGVGMGKFGFGVSSPQQSNLRVQGPPSSWGAGVSIGSGAGKEKLKEEKKE